MSDAAEPDAGLIAATAGQLAATGMLGLIWLDDELIVRGCLGMLAQPVAAGAHIAESLIVLLGQDQRIKAIRSSHAPPLHLANIALMLGGRPQQRMNISVSSAADGGYVVLLGRVLEDDSALENEIRKRRIADAALARINQQLEEFAYVISHDLKAPLRALRYLSGDVATALAAEPADLATARRTAGDIATQTQRMSAMLVGLLEYSRVGRQREVIEEVDTAGLVAAIVHSLHPPAGMAIAVEGAWPRLRTVAVPLDLALRNLIGNALKHHDRATGTVVASATEAEAHWIFAIADDGPGIAPEWHAAIFEPFRKVDDGHHPDSSGIGLALVKRAVGSVGGRVDVHSDPAMARGTIFRVHWPKRLAG